MMVLFFSFTITAPDRGEGYFLEPESGREVAFESILGILFIIYLWVLVYRFSTKGKRPLPLLAKGGVILLIAIFILGISFKLFLFLRK